MLLDASQFAFTRALEAGHATFWREAAALTRADYEPWPDLGAYGGTWLAFPLFLQSHPRDVDACFARNQGRCPESTALLRRIRGVVSAGFSWLEPGCHIYPHVDKKPVDLLRAHLGLEIPAGALMRVGTDRHTWREGGVLLFDGFVEHETANTAAARRVVLLVDAIVEGEEFATLQRWRAEHGIVP
jgi:hypothetical protein